ncbi:adenylyl cyclase-associated protein 2 [Paroedura picta]|uniref:adenylyl cyclase-associated protein 2 n=1 Tax=Paroedura picta TaxID=143630 RepID=UPI004056BF03
MAETQVLMERLESAVVKLESLLSNAYKSAGMECGTVNGVDEDVAPYVKAFDRILNGSVADFLRNSKILDGDVKIHAEMIRAAFQAERAFLLLTSQYQEPQESEVAILLKPISDKILEIQTFRERNRGSKMFNHLSAVSESVPALGWIAVAPKPGPYVKEMNDAATFYTNRVLKDYKHSDLRHVDWVKSYLNIWADLQGYIKEYHTTGLTWSSTGPIASAASLLSTLASGQSPPPPPLPPPPPPPPPPPGPPPVFDTENGKDDTATTRSALFAQLNQGETITKGLRHVSDDQKTHKNPSLRAQGTSVRSPTKSHTSSPATLKTPLQQSHCPVLELEGKKWRVEYQEDKNDLLITDTELKQVAYIFKCNKSTLQMKGKINSITIDNCKKFGLVFNNVVGIVEVINSKDIQIQVLGKVPTISINKTEGCHIYLSEESLDCEIVSAKSSEMNILIPQDGDYKEFPVPEQFKTSWDGSKLVTDPTEIVG